MSVMNRNRAFRSSSGLNAVVANSLFFLFSVYLIYRHWHTVAPYALCIYFIPVGMQIISQFQRADRLLRFMEPQPPKFESELFDLLFWAALSNFFLLAYVAGLLRHIDGFL